MRLLASEKDGRKAYYQIAEPHLANIMACIEARFGRRRADFFGHKYRNIGIFQLMSDRLDTKNGRQNMEILIPLGMLVAWIILQAWVLPRLGVKT